MEHHLILFHCPFVEDLGGDVLGGNIDALAPRLVEHVGEEPHLELKAEDIDLVMCFLRHSRMISSTKRRVTGMFTGPTATSRPARFRENP